MAANLVDVVMPLDTLAHSQEWLFERFAAAKSGGPLYWL